MFKRSLLLCSMIFATLVSGAAMADPPGRPADNFCNKMLDAEAATAYDEAGVKKLLEAKRECPLNVTLDETVRYVDELLMQSFDDPYTVVLPPESAERMRQEYAGKAEAFKGGGIGTQLSFDATKIIPNPPLPPDERTPPKLQFLGLIYHVVADSPAAKVGLRDGDIIKEVDGKPVIGLDADYVVGTLLRGDVGTKVKLTVQRGTRTFKRTLTREKVITDNVWSRHLGDGIYSIVITDFERRNTGGEILSVMQSIGKKARGFVFDVRNNPGGIVDEAVIAASFLVQDGLLMTQRERIAGDPATPVYHKITWTRRNGKLIMERINEADGVVLQHQELQLSSGEIDETTGEPIGELEVKDFPMLAAGRPVVVLANGSSASAAEIFTGAVTQNRVTSTDALKAQGGIFIGVNTFGKFIGQSVFSGPAGTMIKATSFRYFSPRGEWLGDAWKNRTGLTPDIEVKQPENGVPYTATDAQLNAAIDFIKKANAAAVPARKRS